MIHQAKPAAEDSTTAAAGASLTGSMVVGSTTGGYKTTGVTTAGDLTSAGTNGTTAATAAVQLQHFLNDT